MVFGSSLMAIQERISYNGFRNPTPKFVGILYWRNTVVEFSYVIVDKTRGFHKTNT